MLKGVSGPELDSVISRLTHTLPGETRGAFGIGITNEGVRVGVRAYLDDEGKWQAKAYAGADALVEEGGNLKLKPIVGFELAGSW